MNNDYLISKLTGKWIVQSTSYSLSRYHKSKNSFINQIKWIHVKDCSPCFKFMASDLEKQYSLSDIDLYRIESKNNKSANGHKYYILLASKEFKLKLVIKLNHKFVTLNKFVVNSQSPNHLSIMSRDKNLSIVEKIYFLNRNLKVVKSTIWKRNNYICTSFSSEIRIDQ